MLETIIYTDGACSGNPGPGGYAYILLQEEKIIKRKAQGYRYTTSNRMELMAAIAAVSDSHENTSITLYTDSQYLSNSINLGWLNKWSKRDFTKIVNPDLWKQLYNLVKDRKVAFIWIQGHKGNKYNELCDIAAKNACKLPQLHSIDIQYELKRSKG